jgi:ribose 5-phosphate isomerase B
MDQHVIAIGADQGGFRLKTAIVAFLRDAGHDVRDLGSHSPDRVDYPDYAHKVCAEVIAGRARFGVLVCGTGVGMAIAANRHPDIRCAQAAEATTARLSRAHNDANVIALGGRLVAEEAAFDIVTAFLSTPFDGGRHSARLAKLSPKEFA